MRDNQENIVEAEPTPKPLGKTGRVLFTISMSIIIISILMCGVSVNNFFRVPRATADAEWILTEAHGEEVFEVIQNFKSNWTSLETDRNPSIRLELAVTPFLNDYWLATPEPGTLCNGSDCGIETTFETTSVRVFEYSPERFKAIACHLASDYLYEFHILYVFVYVEDIWKLEGLYNVTIPNDAYRDWEYLPESYQKIIGPLPSNLSCETRLPD